MAPGRGADPALNRAIAFGQLPGIRLLSPRPRQQDWPTHISCPEQEVRMKRVGMMAAAAVVCGLAGLTAQGGRGGQSAQGMAPQRNWYSVTVTTIKPERVADWVSMQKSETIPMQQKGGIKQRDTWQSGAPFGEGNTFAIVTPIDKFATYDMPNLARRVLGDAAQAYQSKLAAMTVARRTFAIQDRAELSIPPAANAKIVAAVLTTTTIVSGHAEQYEAYLKNDLVPLLKKDNAVGFLVSRTVFGGDANEYTTLLLLSSFADIDKGPAQARLLSRTEAAAMAAKVTPHVARVERTLIRHVPDLSYGPRPTS
jgi:hypothetical protein